jgi:hypothetical protein
MPLAAPPGRDRVALFIEEKMVLRATTTARPISSATVTSSEDRYSGGRKAVLATEAGPVSAS